MTENTNNFSNRNVAFISVAVAAIFAGIVSMLFVDTEPATPDPTNDIEVIEVVAEPDIIENLDNENLDDEEVEPAFDEANNVMTENNEH